jgi:hypothetical protein
MVTQEDNDYWTRNCHGFHVDTPRGRRGKRSVQVHRSLFMSVAAAVAAGATAVGALADVTPIGPLPPGPVTKIDTKRGLLVAAALPRQNPSTGLVWRLARRVDGRVLKQVSEADVGPSVVVVFSAVGRGSATVRFALTRGESSAKALKSATYTVTIR